MDEETLRKEFEEWAERNLFHMRAVWFARSPVDGAYRDCRTHDAWVAWLEATRRADKRNLDRIGELEAALKNIAEHAHDNSAGPAVPDHLWDVRRIAYDAL